MLEKNVEGNSENLEILAVMDIFSLESFNIMI